MDEQELNVEEILAMSEEDLTEKITEIAFEIIAAVGTARGMYMEAIQEAKKGNYDAAHKLMEDGREVFVQGHHAHKDILTMQGAGVKLPMNIFLMHAEDQLMASDSFEVIANEEIELYQQLNELKAKL